MSYILLLFPSRYPLHNKIVIFLQEKGLRWQHATLALGNNFVGVLGDNLWYTDPHRLKFEASGCALQDLFDQFQGCNQPTVHRYVAQPMEVDRLKTFSQLLYNLLDQVRMYSNCFERSYRHATGCLRQLCDGIPMCVLCSGMGHKATVAGCTQGR